MKRISNILLFTLAGAGYIDADGNKIDETEIVREVISLQGVTGSPNFKATQEWFAFEQEYDKDHTLLYETDKHPIDVPSAYDVYKCLSGICESPSGNGAQSRKTVLHPA